MTALSAHSSQLASAVVDSGALGSLLACLEVFDPSVKGSAAWALGHLARHAKGFAQTAVGAGAVPLLALCF